MKKILLIIISLILLVAAVFITLKLFKSSTPSQDIKPIIKSQETKQVNFKNATYTIEGQTVTLKNTTHYFGNEAIGDLNSDGNDDVAFLLTQDGGGSGTFYYITAALMSDQGYQGLNAIFLGDRIAPQTTEIKDGKIIVNYADRKPNEPFTTAPSVGVSRYFEVINNQLTETK